LRLRRGFEPERQRRKIDGTRHTIYGKASLTMRDRIGAAQKFAQLDNARLTRMAGACRRVGTANFLQAVRAVKAVIFYLH
jgi:hypothetical protein